MEIFFSILEELFNGKVFVFSDFLVVNRYGEEVDEEISFYIFNYN